MVERLKRGCRHDANVKKLASEEGSILDRERHRFRKLGGPEMETCADADKVIPVSQQKRVDEDGVKMKNTVELWDEYLGNVLPDDTWVKVAALMEKAKILHIERRFDDAQQTISTLMETKPCFTGAMLYGAKIYLDMGYPSRALELLEKFILTIGKIPNCAVCLFGPYPMQGESSSTKMHSVVLLVPSGMDRTWKVSKASIIFIFSWA